jgi:ribose 5-phosphate isomerase A
MADSTKLVRELGHFLLPIEVVLFGHEWTHNDLKKTFSFVSIRKTVAGEIFKTNSGNVIYDCQITDGIEIGVLDTDLCQIPGVITSGLFYDFIDILLTVQNENIIEICEPKDVFW